jgi:hypothetical protein
MTELELIRDNIILRKEQKLEAIKKEEKSMKENKIMSMAKMLIEGIEFENPLVQDWADYILDDDNKLTISQMEIIGEQLIDTLNKEYNELAAINNFYNILQMIEED